MSFQLQTRSLLLRQSPRFQAAKQEMLSVILESSRMLQGVKSQDSRQVRETYSKLLQEFSRDRGRDLYFPFLASGLGHGSLVELADGSVKYDMITGVGIHFFGHTHPALIEEMIDSLPSDVMQGNLEPGIEMQELLRLILSKVGDQSRLKHGWMVCSGTMANEIALKIIRQKKATATQILAFKDCFAGRSTTMQEITDNPAYRQGQPIYGQVHYLPFYNPEVGLKASIQATQRAMEEHLCRYPGMFACLMIELIQGEGGFHYAPQEFYVEIFQFAKKVGLAIWVDEVQSFGRTGELFAYQKFHLNEFVDVVTLGKMLQACLVLYTEEFNPNPGLVAGTFSGSTVALKTARRVVELLCQDGYLGEGGKIEKKSARFVERLSCLQKKDGSGLIGEIRALGGMIAFVPLSGSMDDVKAVLIKLFDRGVVAFYCGHGPFLIRMLPPLGVLSEDEIDQVCAIITEVLAEQAERKKGVQS